MASKAERGSEANGADRRTVANHSSTSMAPRAVAATVCWARMSSGLAGTLSRSILPASIRSTVMAVCTRSARCFGNRTPWEISPTWWPARPTRCSPLATEGGDSTCTTRSTAPMSMPSSREDVATTQRSRPDFRSSSIRARWSLDTEPWWARASTGSAPAVLPAWAIMWAGVAVDAGCAAAPPDGSRRPDGAGLGTPAAGVEVRGAGAKVRPAAAGGHELAFGVDLVEPGGQPFGEPAGVREHDGGLVGQHQVHDLLLHMRPDGGLRLQPGGRAGVEGPGGALEIGHVLHRDGDGQVPVLPRRRGDDFHRRRAGEELRHQLLGLHGGREPDPLGGLGQQRVEAFQRHRQMRAALGAGDGVDLVDDDGVHLAEGLPRLGRQHQEERFGGGDEDVRRVAEQRAAVRRRRVPGPDARR